MCMKELIERLIKERTLSRQEWHTLLKGLPDLPKEEEETLFAAALRERERVYGKDVYIRGLIEFSSYCRCDCYYCGLRSGNGKAQRYRLTKEEILACCKEGYALGFRTFVLQSGEDRFFTASRLADIVEAIRSNYPDCAVTLSVGERKREDYALWKKAGADRYLLRHETACPGHYGQLHPPAQTLQTRQRCLWDLKELGYQVGSGFMVGSPYQTADTLLEDMFFLQQLSPHMVGIGPFIPHHDTPFAHFPAGGVSMTLRLLAILRLMLPGVLLPATTALATLDPIGREKAMRAGANVVMPNLSPQSVRKKYDLYDHKVSSGSEAAEAVEELRTRMAAAGFTVVVSRGDSRVPV